MYKSSEEIALENALLAQAEWRAKVAANKQAVAREKKAGGPRTLAQAAPKRAPTVPRDLQVLHRQSM